VCYASVHMGVLHPSNILTVRLLLVKVREFRSEFAFNVHVFVVKLLGFVFNE
jgi:hypothetical protein